MTYSRNGMADRAAAHPDFNIEDLTRRFPTSVGNSQSLTSNLIL